MSNHVSLNQIKVGLDFGSGTIPVGRLASRNGQIYFEFDEEFVHLGLNISPLRLPLERGLQTSSNIKLVKARMDLV